MAFSPSYGFNSPTSVFLPQAMENLVVNFARDPKKFAVNRLTTIHPVKAIAGAWQRFNPSDLSRVLKDPNQFTWEDGQPLPIQSNNKQGHSWVEYRCQRRAMADVLGYLEKSQAVTDMENVKFAALGHKAMTARTVRFYAVAFDTANHLSANVKTATSWGGGKWDVATGTNNYIQKTFQNIGNQIILGTAGSVDWDQITCVISPYVAFKMSQSQEVRDYLAQAPASVPFLTGTGGQGLNLQYGLPDRLYGIKIEVDKTVQNDVVYGDTDSVDYAIGTSALFIARPGELVMNGVESQFSAIHTMVFEGNEMVTKLWDDSMNERYVLSVVDHYDIRPVCNEAMAIATAIVD